MHVSIRQIGNSQGVVIPKPILAQLGLNGEAGAEMTIEGGALVLRRPASAARTGWAAAAKQIAAAGDDALVMGDAPPLRPRLRSIRDAPRPSRGVFGNLGRARCMLFDLSKRLARAQV